METSTKILLIILVTAIIIAIYKTIKADRIEKSEEEDDDNYEEFIPKTNDPWEKCKACKFFDGYDMCLHRKNFGAITDESEQNCNKNKLFKTK